MADELITGLSNGVHSPLEAMRAQEINQGKVLEPRLWTLAPLESSCKTLSHLQPVRSEHGKEKRPTNNSDSLASDASNGARTIIDTKCHSERKRRISNH